MENVFSYNGKTYAFESAEQAQKAREMIPLFVGMGKSPEQVGIILAGLANSAILDAMGGQVRRAEKSEFEKAVEALNTEINATEAIKELQPMLAEQWATLSERAGGLEFETHGNYADAWVTDPYIIRDLVHSAFANQDVTFDLIPSYDTDVDEGQDPIFGYTVRAKPPEGVAQVEALMINAAKPYITDSKLFAAEGEQNGKTYSVAVVGSKVVVRAQGKFSGGSAAGAAKTSKIELTFAGRSYDGKKGDVAQKLIAAGLTPGAKYGGKDVPNLSSNGATGTPYYAKWLQVAAEKDLVKVVKLYN
jgi:hypothetical protein